MTKQFCPDNMDKAITNHKDEPMEWALFSLCYAHVFWMRVMCTPIISFKILHSCMQQVIRKHLYWKWSALRLVWVWGRDYW